VVIASKWKVIFHGNRHEPSIEDPGNKKWQSSWIQDISIFVCTDNPIINIDRVEARVRKGGHRVDANKIIARYQSTLKLLKESVSITYRSYLFDNSGQKMILISESYKGQLKIMEEDLPQWFKNVFEASA
jgi:predicted ABC-type ATPase